VETIQQKLPTNEVLSSQSCNSLYIICGCCSSQVRESLEDLFSVSTTIPATLSDWIVRGHCVIIHSYLPIASSYSTS